MAENKTNLIMYTTEDGVTKIQATFDNDTVWLSIDQMAELFQRDKSTISRHIKNIFEEGEYISDSVVANFATTAKDGKTYQVEYYNLDKAHDEYKKYKAKEADRLSFVEKHFLESIRKLENKVENK